jgi:hypothetical protein
MVALADVAQSLEGPKDFGDDAAASAQRWISEINLAEKDHHKWRARSRKVIAKYRNDQADPSTDVKARRLSLFWSNMETLEPSIFARAPTAVVGRRWKVRWVCRSAYSRYLATAWPSTFGTRKTMAARVRFLEPCQWQLVAHIRLCRQPLAIPEVMARTPLPR